MPINDLNREATTPNGIPDLPAFEAVVGDVLNFTPIAVIGAPTVTLVQKPANSTAAVASGAFTCDFPGVYLVTVANAGFTRAWTVYCFAAATLTQKVGSTPGANTVNRGHLRSLVNGAGPLGAGQVSSLRTTLEQQINNVPAAAAAFIGVSWAPFGN